jgi:hypothetical protein
MCAWAYVCINSFCYICISHVHEYTYAGMNVSASAYVATFAYIFTCIGGVYVSSCFVTTSSAVYRILCVIYTVCVMFVTCVCVHCDFTTYVCTCVWVYTRYVLPVCIDTCKRVCEVTIRAVCCYVCVHACILCMCVETTHSHARSW